MTVLGQKYRPAWEAQSILEPKSSILLQIWYWNLHDSQSGLLSATLLKFVIWVVKLYSS